MSFKPNILSKKYFHFIVYCLRTIFLVLFGGKKINSSGLGWAFFKRASLISDPTHKIRIPMNAVIFSSAPQLGFKAFTRKLLLLSLKNFKLSNW